jgi:hypothetical protein
MRGKTAVANAILEGKDIRETISEASSGDVKWMHTADLGKDGMGKLFGIIKPLGDAVTKAMTELGYEFVEYEVGGAYGEAIGVIPDDGVITFDYGVIFKETAAQDGIEAALLQKAKEETPEIFPDAKNPTMVKASFGQQSFGFHIIDKAVRPLASSISIPNVANIKFNGIGNWSKHMKPAFEITLTEPVMAYDAEVVKQRNRMMWSR